MERFFIKSHAWAMINEKTGESETENMGPWYNHKDVTELEAENKLLKDKVKVVEGRVRLQSELEAENKLLKKQLNKIPLCKWIEYGLDTITKGE